MELFSRIKTLQVEQMSVKKRSMSFSYNLKRRKSVCLIIWRKKCSCPFLIISSWNKVCTFEMSVSQKARDQRTSKSSCHVQSRKVGHIQSQDFVKYKSQFWQHIGHGHLKKLQREEGGEKVLEEEKRLRRKQNSVFFKMFVSNLWIYLFKKPKIRNTMNKHAYCLFTLKTMYGQRCRLFH